MNFNFDGNELIIELEGRIDSSNAAEKEKEIFEAVNEHKPEKVVVDAQKLEYISSVGLRTMLKLKKTIDSTRIINVSLEVYDVFDMTGFTDIIDIRKAMREVSVEGCEIIGKGGHGTVYRIDGDTIVKLYNEDEPFDEIEREISYSKKAFVYGIPTAISFDIVKCGNCYGVVFELINADTLTNRINAEPENFDSYSKKYSEVVHKLHTTEADKSIFSDIKDLYNKWADDMLKYLTQKEVDILHDIINSVPDSNTFIHGDIHPKNMMVQDGELLLIDMADLTYGHPVFDYAGIMLTHVLSGKNNPEYTKMVTGIDCKSALALWDNLLKSNFAGKTEDELNKVKNAIMGMALLKYAISPAVNKNMNENLVNSLIENSRKNFFPQAKNFIGAIDF